MKHRWLFALLGPCLALAGGLPGCAQKTKQVAPPEAPVVPVSQPVEREVTDYVDFTGRTDAVQSVDVRARVTGYLKKVLFREGAEVKEDQQLFEIDPRPYKDQLDQQLAQVTLNEASLLLAQTTLQRDVQAGTAAVSPQQIDQDRAAVEEAKARIKASQATLEQYQLNLAFTKVVSPIAGQVSRYYLTPGNLVLQDQTLLTTVVSPDPMYAYFDMDAPTVLKIRRQINKGRIQKRQPEQWDNPTFVASSVALPANLPGAGALGEAAVLAAGSGTPVPVYMGLQEEEGYPHKGLLNFVNNQFNPTTDSISVRAVFPNAKPPGGTRLLSPGMFVRIRLPVGQPHKALLVIDRAVGSDQGLKFVYVLDKDNKIQQRRVTLGSLQEDGLRVIQPSTKKGEGIQKGDWVVVGAVLQVRPRMVVQPERIPMPTLGPAPEPQDELTR